jgi:hypothetical protein
VSQTAYLFFYADDQKPYGLHRVSVAGGKALETHCVFRASTPLQVRTWKAAPNGRQIALHIFRDLIWVNLYPDSQPEWRWLLRDAVVYPSAWSPDGRYLLASRDNRFQDLIVIDVLSGDVKTLLEPPNSEQVLDSTLPHRVDLRFHGWYPQSDAIWYAVQRLSGTGKSNRSERTWYRHPMPRGQPVRLPSDAVRSIHSDWEFVRGSIRSGYPEGTPFEKGWLHYTADGAARILRQAKGETYPPQYHFRYQRRGSGWTEIPHSDVVLDVSADKRRLLRVKTDTTRGRKTYYAYDVHRGTKETLYECTSQEAWFHAPLVAAHLEESSFLV